jgi:excisionase family DNA binding protein
MDTTTNTQTEHTVTSANDKSQDRPTFYTVAEAARLLRVDPATIYRAIRADAFPAVRVRSRYVIPAVAVEQMAEQAATTGTCVDVAAIATARRIGREVTRMIGGQS